ncbi:unnamed protein product [Rotaria socialis]|uniref:MULE transposase domain-containing protein n=2 Tax=Rotaria socialis TaxID=392032 RepID=A0A817UW91_9BILA|nr:unnamed protein product [Rotaria socialis]CAF3416115.1 unnamed protein product [Rotaria socialis]CAF4301574.1 unnamed protein product [Rotaria socialis]CAF4652743.1 unnamed protein product [Rotaria socialis]
MDTKFTWSITQKGEKALLCKNYLYGLRRENKNGSLVYACTNKSCPRVITLKNDAIIQCDVTRHNHDPRLTDDVQNVFTGLKRRVITDVDKSIGKIYEEEVKKFRRANGSAATIPIFDTWRSTLYNTRRAILPIIPTSLDSITIPESMSFTHTNEQFLFCNSTTPHKVIAFASETGLKILSENHHWNADGTFRTAPALFSQAYYIHVWDEYSMKPMVYSCLQDKSQETYINLFQSLVQYAEEKNVILKPSSILIDFEQSSINAINEVFPSTKVKRCHFHYAQNIWKKLKKYGLKKLSKEEHIRREIANIISLPLVPRNEINNSMEHIIDVLCNIDSKFEKFTDYVLNNYVEDARFTSDMWNHFDSIGERSRTNNHVEGWHRQLNARVRTHPDLWTWYNEAKSSEESAMIRHEQEQAQKRTTRPRKAKNIRDDEKLKLGKNKYILDQDFDAYQKVLRSISHRYIDILKDAVASSDEE